MAKSRGRSRASRGETRAQTQEQLEEEYAYVIKDLRQILILALIMFALLIALNLIL